MAKILENLGRRYVLQAGSKTIEWPRRTKTEKVISNEDSFDHFTDLQPAHNAEIKRTRRSMLRGSEVVDVKRENAEDLETRKKKLQWYDDDDYPDLRYGDNEKEMRKRGLTNLDKRMSRQIKHDRLKRGRSFVCNRNYYKRNDYLPYFRSKSAYELDAESAISQFRPVVNHKAVIDHTYNIERSKSRSKSREGIVRKRVVTTPTALREEHREKTLYTDRFRGLKEIYTQSNTEHVEKQFYKRLADVKQEQYRSVSKSRDRDSKHKQKTLLKQIEDLKKINTRYGRAIEKQFNSKFAVYNPTNTAARFKNVNVVHDKLKAPSHDFSKWRHKGVILKSNEHNNERSKTNTNQKHVIKRNYRGPLWEREGLSYMQRLKNQELNEDTSSEDSGKMWELLKEAETMLNVVEENCPETIGKTNRSTGKLSPAKSKSTMSKSGFIPNSPEILNKENTNINTRIRNINLTGSSRHRSTYKRRLPQSIYNKPIFKFERSRVINNKQETELNKNVLHSNMKRTSTESDKYNQLLNNRSPSVFTENAPHRSGIRAKERNITPVNNEPNDKFRDAGKEKSYFTNRKLSGLQKRNIIIPVPPVSGSHKKGEILKQKRDETPNVSTTSISKNESPQIENKLNNATKTSITNEDNKLTLEQVNAATENVCISRPGVLNGQNKLNASKAAVRIDAPSDKSAEYISKIIKTPTDSATPSELILLNKQSLRKSPYSKPSSREKLTSTNERILITPIAVKNKGKAFLVANCRIITPVTPSNENMATLKEETKNNDSNCFLTYMDTGNSQAGENDKNPVIENDGRKSVAIEFSKTEHADDALGLDKWKALVQQYLTEYEKM